MNKPGLPYKILLKDLPQDLLEERGYTGAKGPSPPLQQAFADGLLNKC